MAPLFAKRLSCFYCGRRSALPDRDPVRKWHCKHCEAVNYLDEKGEITDPPTTETNRDVNGFGSSTALESSDSTASSLFCAQCVRNQHLFTSTLASYFPSTDDPNYSAYEREYPKFRKNLEERYPQSCAKCEPLVRARIRQAGYEAKSDHLRRMMDRSKAGRASRQARNWNWRSLLVFAGAIGFWASVAGQLSWNLLGALAAVAEEPFGNVDNSSMSPSIPSCVRQTLQTRQIPSPCMTDLAPYAGLSLVAGILSLWYNPKLRLKVEGRGGRFVGLGEYYKVQLIVMVVRCAFWAVLRDPLSSGLQPTLPPALHTIMIFFTVLSIAVSRRIVRYDTRPLVTWTEDMPAETPKQSHHASPLKSTGGKKTFATPNGSPRKTPSRFPLEKLATPQTAPQEPSIPTPPPEGDDMDWTPSVQHVITPTVSVHQRDQKSVLDGPMPFYGSLPAAPQPLSWALRNKPSQRPKPIEQVVERNPFKRTPSQPLSSWQKGPGRPDVFAPPKFFPLSDHSASTGLESLFDRTFTIKSPEDVGDSWQQQQQQQQQQGSDSRSRQSVDLQSYFIFQYIRLGLLLSSLSVWFLSQYDYLSVPGNYVEVASLGSASLIAGFALLDVLKQPMVQWNGMEILVYFAELLAAVHLGGHLPHASFERHYFDRYGKLLLIFMVVQEALGLLTLFRYSASGMGANGKPQTQPQVQQQNRLEAPSDRESRASPPQRAESASRPGFQSFNSQSSAPPLSFSSSTATGSSFSTHPEMQHQPAFPAYNSGFNKDHSFSLNSLKGNESDASDPFDHDSDTETTVTTATTATNNTIRNIRYGRNDDNYTTSSRRSDLGPHTARNTRINDDNSSPRRSGLGSGLGGLSLEDIPQPRVTRSQTRRFMGDDGRKTPVRNFGRF